MIIFPAIDIMDGKPVRLLRDVRFNCLSPVMEEQVLYNSNRLVVQCYLGTTPYQYAKANQIKVELKQDLPEVIPGTDD